MTDPDGPGTATRNVPPRAPAARRRVLPARLLVVLLAVPAAALGLGELSGALPRLARAAYDHFCRAVPAPAPDPSIVQVLLDNESLSWFEWKEGLPWPLPRAQYALLVSLLSRAGARALVLDLELSNRSASPEDDATLADDLDRAAEADPPLPCVLGIDFLGKPGEQPDPYAGATPQSRAWLETVRDRLAPPVAGTPPGERIPEYASFHPPSQAIGEAVRWAGFVNTTLDPDGVVRRVPLLIRHEGRLYPSLSLATVLALRDEPLRFDDAGHLLVGGGIVPLDAQGQVLVRWRGPFRTYQPAYSAHVVLEAARRWIAEGRGEDDLGDDLQGFRPRDLKGKIVLLGSTATGLLDLRPTPVASEFPGVEVHATVIDNLLHGVYTRDAGRAAPLALALVLALGTIALGWYATRFTGAALGAALAGVAVHEASRILFAKAGLWVDWSAPAVGIALGWTAASAGRYLVERRRREEIRGLFGRYVHATVVDELERRPEGLTLEGKRVEATVFFADLCNFTGLSEHRSPPEVARMLNAFHTVMTERIQAHRGTIDKYIGDCQMAFWGAPIPDADHALHACLAALDGLAALDAFREEAVRQGLPALDARIGINSGEVVVGDLGSRILVNYTVVGDAVNLASRLQDANKVYDTRILAGEETWARVQERLVGRELDLLRVKGKETPTRVYEILARAGQAAAPLAELLERFPRLLRLYREGQFREALAEAEALLHAHPEDGPTALYVRRCRAFLAHPPPSPWDGVTVLTTKESPGAAGSRSDQARRPVRGRVQRRREEGWGSGSP